MAANETVGDEKSETKIRRKSSNRKRDGGEEGGGGGGGKVGDGEGTSLHQIPSRSSRIHLARRRSSTHAENHNLNSILRRKTADDTFSRVSGITFGSVGFALDEVGSLSGSVSTKYSRKGSIDSGETRTTDGNQLVEMVAEGTMTKEQKNANAKTKKGGKKSVAADLDGERLNNKNPRKKKTKRKARR